MEKARNVSSLNPMKKIEKFIHDASTYSKHMTILLNVIYKEQTVFIRQDMTFSIYQIDKPTSVYPEDNQSLKLEK